MCWGSNHIARLPVNNASQENHIITFMQLGNKIHLKPKKVETSASQKLLLTTNGRRSFTRSPSGIMVIWRKISYHWRSVVIFVMQKFQLILVLIYTMMYELMNLFWF